MIRNVLHAVYIGLYKMFEVYNTATVQGRFILQLALYTKALLQILYEGREGL